LLDFGVQPLILNETIIDDLGSTNVDFDSCPYWILISMGGSNTTHGLTKHKVVILMNPTKPIDYIIV
jgi:hypothetical protein